MGILKALSVWFIFPLFYKFCLKRFLSVNLETLEGWKRKKSIYSWIQPNKTRFGIHIKYGQVCKHWRNWYFRLGIHMGAVSKKPPGITQGTHRPRFCGCNFILKKIIIRFWKLLILTQLRSFFCKLKPVLRTYVIAKKFSDNFFNYFEK